MISLTIQELFDVRYLAQRLLKEGKFKYKVRAVRSAVRATLTMKKYYGGYRKETTNIKRKVEKRTGEQENNSHPSRTFKVSVVEVEE